MNTLLIITSILLHGFTLFLTIKVVEKYEPHLKTLCPRKSFNPFSFPAVRLWTIILSFVVALGFLLISLQLLVASWFTISLQYLVLDIGAAMLNINYLILMLLEKRGVHSHG